MGFVYHFFESFIASTHIDLLTMSQGRYFNIHYNMSMNVIDDLKEMNKCFCHGNKQYFDSYEWIKNKY